MGLRDDPRWSFAKTPGERLRWAREANDLSQQALVDRAQLQRRDNRNAGAMGRGGYNKYEDGSTPLPQEHAVILAKKLGVRWQWLMCEDNGAPVSDADHEPAPTPPVERVRRALEGRPLEEQEELASAIEALIRRRA